jgi:hypothetical protein
MGFSLSSLDPGALAHQLVDSFMPKDMQWVGGLVGAAVDYECGNIPGAAAQAASALSDMKDLPQSSAAPKPGTAGASTSSNGSPAGASTGGSKVGASALLRSNNPPWAYEPAPPPARTTTTTTTTTTTAGTSTTTSTTSTNTGQAPAGGSQTAPQPASAATKTNPPSADWRAASTSSGLGIVGLIASLQSLHPATPAAPPPQTPAAAPPAAPATTTTTTTTTITSDVPAGAPPAAASTPPANGPATEGKSGRSHFAGASGSSAPTPASTTPASKPSSGDPSTISKDNFMNLSDDDFMKAIRDGKIPSEVTDSQEGTLEVQARMNHISEMNQMMTTMMQSMHQMKMGVIDNLKV